VYEVRRRCGHQLALEAPVKVDLVSTVPESATPAAIAYANCVCSTETIPQVILKEILCVSITTNRVCNGNRSIIFHDPFEEEWAYCFANIGRSVRPYDRR